jgi:succinyl-diaminopimelate desuccinylase
MFLAPILLAAVSAAVQHYDTTESKQLVPMLTEVLKFRTYAHNDEARDAQQQWVMKSAQALGLEARDAGKVVEIELPATVPDAPVLGLVVHGDVQPVEEEAWSFPPFAGRVDNGYVYGRGAADDKGPLVQALLAMHAIKESGPKTRTHTIRLLVGSDEESDNTDIAEYLKEHKAPDYSLVLDSAFPVVAGEKAWQALAVTTPLVARPGIEKPYEVVALSAGLAASIVPDHAEITLRWLDGVPQWDTLLKSFGRLPPGTRITHGEDSNLLRIVAYGKSAHAGVNITGGRNALVALARALDGKLPSGGANDLLSFARIAGRDLTGTGFGITDSDPLWGHYDVNVATIKPDAGDRTRATLTINIRRIPPRTGKQLELKLRRFVTAFNTRTGAGLTFGGFFADEPLVFDPNGKLVKRLLASYGAATGEKSPKPAISGGGTYAKRLPNAIAFGMWFPGKPYPGHDVDERITIADLHRGAHVLIRTLEDIVGKPRIVEPFKP